MSSGPDNIITDGLQEKCCLSLAGEGSRGEVRQRMLSGGASTTCSEQQQDTKSSVSIGVARSENGRSLASFLPYCWSGQSWRLHFSLFIQQKYVRRKGMQTLGGASSMLVPRSCQGRPGSKAGLEPRVPHGLLCPLKHMRENWWSFTPQFFPVIPMPMIPASQSVSTMLQASCRHLETLFYLSWAELYSPQIYILTFYPPVPQNVTVIGDRAFKEIIKLK